MRAELRAITPNDFADWNAFVASDRPDPWDDFGWFTLSISGDGMEGADLFQVVVSTPRAVSRAKGNGGRFRGVIVDSFDPDTIARTLRDQVSSINGLAWSDIVDQLQQSMFWEYEGMAGPDVRQ